jgi:hypothetical protein
MFRFLESKGFHDQLSDSDVPKYETSMECVEPVLPPRCLRIRFTCGAMLVERVIHNESTVTIKLGDYARHIT